MLDEEFHGATEDGTKIAVTVDTNGNVQVEFADPCRVLSLAEWREIARFLQQHTGKEAL